MLRRVIKTNVKPKKRKSRGSSDRCLFLRRGFDVVGEPGLPEVNTKEVVITTTYTYKAFEDTGSLSSNTGCHIPQLVLQLGELQSVDHLFGAQV